MTKSRGILGPRVPWTAEQLSALRVRYPDEKTEAIAADMGRKVTTLYQMAARLGLKKSEQFKASPASGRTNGRQGIGTRFEKGSMAWNKGTKGLNIGGIETQFKPGQMPYNTQPIGSYRLDGCGTLQRKTSNAKGSNSKRWRGVHELVWIEANGPVPPKHIVVFKRGMKTSILEEITLDKVECISLAENMKRNTRHNLPKELADIVALRGALNRQINKRSST